MTSKIRLEITTVIEIPFGRSRFANDKEAADALSFERERAASDPSTVSMLGGKVVEVQGAIVESDEQASAPDWQDYPAASHLIH